MAGIALEEGRVKRNSRIYRHLTEKHLRKAIGLGPRPELSLKRLNGSHPVFLLRDHERGKQFVLKSFYDRGISTTRLRRRMNKEYRRLELLMRAKAGGSRSRCVRPICRDSGALFFIMEDVRGRDLAHYAALALRGD